MNKTWFVLSTAVLAAPVAAFADNAAPPPADVGIYYSYANQKYEGITQNPGGSGVGIEGQWNLPYNLFVDGLAQYNNQYAESYTQDGLDYPGVGFENRQVRAGGGMQFFVPHQPLTLFGKVDYVHYGYHEDAAGQEEATNDDGAGYFLGFSTRNRGVRLYAQGGYLELSDTHGQEGFGGLSVPIGRFSPRGPATALFVEYRWTHATEVSGGAHDIDYDYRMGLDFPLSR